MSFRGEESRSPMSRVPPNLCRSRIGRYEERYDTRYDFALSRGAPTKNIAFYRDTTRPRDHTQVVP
jgi:hypothetical protein